MLFYSAVYFVFWAVLVPHKRYLIPIFPLCGVMIGYLVDRISNFNRFFKISLYTIFILTVLFQMFYLAPEGLDKIYQRILVFSGLKSQEEYILRNEETYAVFKYINENSPAEAKVWVLNDPRTFYCDRPYVKSFGFERTDSAEEILAKLKKERITHFVFNQHLWELRYGGGRKYPTMINVLKAEYLDAVYEKYPFIIWRISYPKGGYGG